MLPPHNGVFSKISTFKNNVSNQPRLVIETGKNEGRKLVFYVYVTDFLILV